MKKQYEVPVLDVISIRMERNFTASELGLTPSNPGSRDVEERQNGGSWGNGGWY